MFVKCILCLIIVLCFLYKYFRGRKSKRLPPGPFKWPLFGNIFLIKTLSKQFKGLHLVFEHLAIRYNSDVLSLKLGQENVIVVFGKETVTKVLTDDNFLGRPKSFFLKLRCFGELSGVTCTDGIIWRKHRKFLVQNMRKLGFGKSSMNEEINIESTKILEKLEKQLECDRALNVDIKPILAQAIFNVLWSIVTNEKIDSDSSTNFETFLDLMDKRSKAFDMSGGYLNHFSWIRFFAPKLIGFELIESMNSSLKRYLNEIVERHEKQMANDDVNDTDDIIRMYLREIDNNTTEFNRKHLLVLLLDLFIAGFQTTTNSISFTLLLIAIHEDVQTKLFDELRLVFGKSKDVAYGIRQKTPYLNAVIAESMRLYHVTPIIGPRRNYKDTTINGYFIPKNSTILLSMYSIHNDRKTWSDCDKFKPERFIYETTAEVLSFGLGKRRCLGEILAKNCMYTLIATILLNFKVKCTQNVQFPLNPVPGITLCPQKYSLNFDRRH